MGAFHKGAIRRQLAEAKEVLETIETSLDALDEIVENPAAYEPESENEHKQIIINEAADLEAIASEMFDSTGRARSEDGTR